jgi:hypothetical protein
MGKPSINEQGGFFIDYYASRDYNNSDYVVKIVRKENHSRQFQFAANLFYTINTDKLQ